jgi:hypothetical protein
MLIYYTIQTPREKIKAVICRRNLVAVDLLNSSSLRGSSLHGATASVCARRAFVGVNGFAVVIVVRMIVAVIVTVAAFALRLFCLRLALLAPTLTDCLRILFSN